MIRKVSFSSNTKRNLTFISLLSFGVICSSPVGQAYATQIHPISSHILPIMADVHATHQATNEHSTNSHPIIHALTHLFGAKSNGTSTVPASHPAVTNSVKTPVFHRWLSLAAHLTREMFTLAPMNFSPSPKTLANATGKTPVILVHGTWANGNILQNMYKSLDNAGIPTYVSTFGTGGHSLLGLIPRMGGVAPAAQAEKELSDYIAQVQKETGASKVDLVGHSQGGLLIKDYLAHDDKDNVQAVVDLGATNHGTTLSGGSHILNLFPKPIKNLLVKGIGLIAGPGATDQLPDSAFIQDLNKYPDTKAGIHYLVFGTKNDLISTPYQNTYLKAVPGADVTNMEVHSIPGVTGFMGHNLYPIFPSIINKVTQYIQEKGEPVGMKSFENQSEANSVAQVPTSATNISTSGNPRTLNSPAVNLLG